MMKNILEDLQSVNEDLEHVGQRNKILQKEAKFLIIENSRLKEKLRTEIDQKNVELKAQHQRSEDQMITLKENFNAELYSQISHLENKLSSTAVENNKLLKEKDVKISELMENLLKLQEKSFQINNLTGNEMHQRILMGFRIEYESKIQSLYKENENLKKEIHLLKEKVTHLSDTQMKVDSNSNTVSLLAKAGGSSSGPKQPYKRKLFKPDESLLNPSVDE